MTAEFVSLESFERMKKEVLDLMLERGVLKLHNPNREDGLFKLKSGRLSNFYINIKEAVGYPDINTLLVKLLSSNLPKESHLVASGLGGHTLASSILIEAKRQGKYALACYDRGEAKSHGTGKVLEGVVPSNESFVIIPDDVFTTGKSVVQTVISLVNSGISTLPKGILVVANRSEPYQNSLQLPENYIEIIESMKGKLVDEIYTKIQETVNEMRSIGSESFVEITILELFKDADFKKE